MAGESSTIAQECTVLLGLSGDLPGTQAPEGLLQKQA